MPSFVAWKLKTVALEAWDRMTPQGEPTGSYTKILQGPNESYADFLARLETAISHTVIGEEAKRQLEKLNNQQHLLRPYIQMGLSSD